MDCPIWLDLHPNAIRSTYEYPYIVSNLGIAEAKKQRDRGSKEVAEVTAVVKEQVRMACDRSEAESLRAVHSSSGRARGALAAASSGNLATSISCG